VFFGLQLPALIGESKTLEESIAEFHETIGNLDYFLIGLHSAAALLYRYRLRDNTLRRMLLYRFDTNGDLNN